MNRKTSVAGSFYPTSCSEIEGFIDRFNTILKKHNIDIKKEHTKALIVPHAGYIYSGFTANIAYKAVKKEEIKRVVVIGPSHKVFLEGMSVGLYDEYETPCGNLKVDRVFSQKIVDEYPFASFFPEAHKEHSTETQFPFIKHYFDGVKVVEIVYGRVDPKLLSLVINEIVEQKDTLIVISTDLSHFYDLQKAKILDSICVEAIIKKDIKLFDKGCEACGLIGVKAVVEVAKQKGYKVELLDYRTSFDITRDDDSVVGYSSFVITS